MESKAIPSQAFIDSAALEVNKGNALAVSVLSGEDKGDKKEKD